MGEFSDIRARQIGFTITEVLIVIAVMSALFLAGASFLAGRQNRTEFSIAVQQVQSQIQQAINEVSIGQYPTRNNLNCTAGGSGPSMTQVATGQGTNSGCIFLGKVIQFGVSGTNPEQFITYTIAGLQQSGGSEVTTLTQAKPLVVAPGSTAVNATIPDQSQKNFMPAGLTTTFMNYNGAATNVGAVAFVVSLAQYSGGSVISGSQHVDVIPINGSALGQTETQAVNAIDATTAGNGLANSPTNPSDFQLCLKSGGSSQSGLITIGKNAGQLAVNLSIKENTSCT